MRKDKAPKPAPAPTPPPVPRSWKKPIRPMRIWPEYREEQKQTPGYQVGYWAGVTIAVILCVGLILAIAAIMGHWLVRLFEAVLTWSI